MNIEANIKKTFSEGNVRSIADVTIDGAFAIHGLKLIEGSKGMFVAMPYAQWQDKNGQMHNTDIAHPITEAATFSVVSEESNVVPVLAIVLALVALLVIFVVCLKRKNEQ